MPNRRTLMTKKNVRESLAELLKNKPADKITVSSLCLQAGINRSTFYAHYQSVYEVLEEMKNAFIETYLPFANYSDRSDISKEKFMVFFENVRTQGELLSILIKNTTIVDDVTQPARESLKKLYADRWGSLTKSMEIYLDAETTFITFGFFATVSRWAELGCETNPDYLYDILKSSVVGFFGRLQNTAATRQL